jgi:hypothetical protein
LTRGWQGEEVDENKTTGKNCALFIKMHCVNSVCICFWQLFLP